MDLEAERRTEGRAVDERLKVRWVVEMMDVRTRMQLDRRGSELARPLDGCAVCVDEETRRNAGGFHAGDARANALRIGLQVEAALGGDLLPALGNEHHLVGSEPFGD